MTDALALQQGTVAKVTPVVAEDLEGHEDGFPAPAQEPAIVMQARDLPFKHALLSHHLVQVCPEGSEALVPPTRVQGDGICRRARCTATHPI